MSMHLLLNELIACQAAERAMRIVLLLFETLDDQFGHDVAQLIERTAKRCNLTNEA